MYRLLASHLHLDRQLLFVCIVLLLLCTTDILAVSSATSIVGMAAIIPQSYLLLHFGELYNVGVVSLSEICSSHFDSEGK